MSARERIGGGASAEVLQLCAFLTGGAEGSSPDDASDHSCIVSSVGGIPPSAIWPIFKAATTDETMHEHQTEAVLCSMILPSSQPWPSAWSMLW